MGLEVATYINELQETNPTSSDIKSQGDDHLRVIKGAVKRTFPNITGAVTVTHTQLNAVGLAGTLVQPGIITMWPYSVESIPTGWKLCNGTGTLRDGRAVPNLIDKFPVGAGGTIPLLGTGGSASHSHTVGVTVAGTALTVAQLPAHTHGINNLAVNISTSTGAGHYSVANDRGAQSGSAGSGEAHTHTATGTANSVTNLPPYLGLLFIIKD